MGLKKEVDVELLNFLIKDVKTVMVDRLDSLTADGKPLKTVLDNIEEEIKLPVKK